MSNGVKRNDKKKYIEVGDTKDYVWHKICNIWVVFLEIIVSVCIFLPAVSVENYAGENEYSFLSSLIHMFKSYVKYGSSDMISYISRTVLYIVPVIVTLIVLLMLIKDIIDLSRRKYKMVSWILKRVTVLVVCQLCLIATIRCYDWSSMYEYGYIEDGRLIRFGTLPTVWWCVPTLILIASFIVMVLVGNVDTKKKSILMNIVYVLYAASASMIFAPLFYMDVDSQLTRRIESFGVLFYWDGIFEWIGTAPSIETFFLVISVVSLTVIVFIINLLGISKTTQFIDREKKVSKYWIISGVINLFLPSLAIAIDAIVYFGQHIGDAHMLLHSATFIAPTYGTIVQAVSGIVLIIFGLICLKPTKHTHNQEKSM